VEPLARTPSGYCDYEPAALDRLAFIRAAQAIGLTLGEIRSILDDRFGIHAQVTPAAGTASTYLVG
jgi:DNA-binding transcriptional MerR regulator